MPPALAGVLLAGVAIGTGTGVITHATRPNRSVLPALLRWLAAIRFSRSRVRNVLRKRASGGE
ncbi:hypothetical protein OPAG_08149 [Rhodococcus opacus PD630]|nr:hypothetical protein OPAG_08149 [Rhodococcus opacus PD630]